MPDGSLLIVSMLDRRVLRLGPDGSLAEHADLTEWAPFHCNDMVVDAAGRAYVGNFGFDIYPRMSGGRGAPAGGADPGRPGGQMSVAAEDLEFPNGTVITPDGQTLIIAESGGRRLTAFDVSANGGLSNRRVWADLRPHQVSPDGICLDASGAVWAANAAGADRGPGRRGRRAAGYGPVLPDLFRLHARRDRRARAVRHDRALGAAGAGGRVAAGPDRVGPGRRGSRRPAMSLGEIQQVSDGIYAYLQPDGSWWLEQRRLPGQRRSWRVASGAPRPMWPGPSVTWWPITAAAR